jgi:hypothetical protein
MKTAMALLSVVGMSVALGGCSTGGPDVTGGVGYTLRASDTRNKLAYFELRPSGELRYTGGISAGMESSGLSHPDWTASFTRAELAPVLELIAQNPEPASIEPTKEQVNYKLGLRTPGKGERRFVSGPTAFFEGLYKRSEALMISRRPELGNPGR